MTRPVTWMTVAEAARLARVPLKTTYRWAGRDDVRRLRLAGRVLVVWEDIIDVKDKLRGIPDMPDGPRPCVRVHR